MKRTIDQIFEFTLAHGKKCTKCKAYTQVQPNALNLSQTGIGVYGHFHTYCGKKFDYLGDSGEIVKAELERGPNGKFLSSRK